MTATETTAPSRTAAGTPTPTARAVLAALVDHATDPAPGGGPAGTTVAQLAAATGLAPATVGGTLRRLSRAGHAIAAPAQNRADTRWSATRKGTDHLRATAPDDTDVDADQVTASPDDGPEPATAGDPDVPDPTPPAADTTAGSGAPDPADPEPDGEPAPGTGDDANPDAHDLADGTPQAADTPTAHDPAPEPAGGGTVTAPEPTGTGGTASASVGPAVGVPACLALSCPAPACPVRTGTTAPPTPTAARRSRPARPAAPAANTDGRPRLLPGQLRTLVVDLLAANPDVVFSVGEVARELGRSQGAVVLVLDKATAAGTLRRVQDKPRRYQAAPATGTAA